MNATVIYHKSDFDGILCREIAERGLRDRFGTSLNLRLIGWEYGEPEPEILPDGPIYILDLSVDSLMTKEELRKWIIWIDHHKSAIEKYRDAFFAGVRIDGVAACRLAYQYFRSDLASPLTKQDFVDRKVVEPELVRLAGEYDIWDHRDPRAAPLQLGLRVLLADDFEWRGVMNQLLGPGSGGALLEEIIDEGELIQKFVDAGAAEAMKQSLLVSWEGLTFRVCNGSRGSLAFKSVMGQGEDALMSWRFDGPQGNITVSLYHTPGKEHLDLSQIAKRYGGGGHRGACGFRVSWSKMGEILGL